MEPREKPNTIMISPEYQGQLTGVYKEVFRGHPWHEDLICANSRRDLDDPQRCMAQYTERVCERFDPNKKTGAIENDCRGNYTKGFDKGAREGIILLPESGLEVCVGCGDQLKLIEFYPHFANHSELIREAIAEAGFIGYVLAKDTKPIGFIWGYTVPEKRTVSVAFPKVKPMLESKGINPRRTFYFAETGVVDVFQNHGFGSALIAKMLKAASESGYDTHITRTINPFIHAVLEKLFSGREGRFLFKDPERGSSWFAWDFRDFDGDCANNLIARVD